MNEDQKQFQFIKHLFSKAQYVEGRHLMNKLIIEHPNNSILYINRALFHTQLDEDILAIDDLQKSIQLSPFNYIAYFNLFSIQMKSNQYFQSYKNLCCALSCMHLLKAKAEKNIMSAQQSLLYSPNNIAAQLLIVILSEKCIQNQDEKTIEQKQFYAQYQRLESMLKNQSQWRLESNILKHENVNLIQQIKQKLPQFNKLYIELNQDNMAQTYKISKQQPLNNMGFIKQKSKASTSNKQSVIAILEDDEYFSRNKQSGILQLQSLNQTNPESIEEINALKEDKQPHQEVYYLQTSHIPTVIQQYQEEQDEQQQLSPSRGEYQIKNHLIYPIPHSTKLNINLICFKFFEPPLPIPKNVYCIISYNEKMSVRSHLVDCQYDQCRWNERFDPIDLAPEPALMRLKLYDKQFNNAYDYFIGEIQFMVDLADLLKLPIYSREQELIGQIMIHLQLVEHVQ